MVDTPFQAVLSLRLGTLAQQGDIVALNKVVLNCNPNCLGSVARAQFGEDVADVIFYGELANT